MPHDCITRVNEQLKEHNTQLSLAYSLTTPMRELIHIRTVKLDPLLRGRPMVLFATYCPICGMKLEREE
jgi:hypothetical protein